jgi:hypothetical protein
VADEDAGAEEGAAILKRLRLEHRLPPRRVRQSPPRRLKKRPSKMTKRRKL